MDACGSLLIIVFVVLFLVGVGHGFWVIIKLLTRQAGKETGTGKHSHRTRCPECGSTRIADDGHCSQCGADVRIQAHGSQPQAHGSQPVGFDATFEPNAAVWTAAERQLRRLFNRGLLSRERLDELLKTLAAERRHAEEKPVTQEPAEAESAGELQTHGLRPVGLVEEIERAGMEEAEEALDILDFDEPEEATREPVPSKPEPAAAAAEKQDWGRLLQAFMEEKNIRWGELLSGMLIVGSAIGLVISLWSTLKTAIPYFPALLFMLATAAIHGAGVYTLRRWKLQSTSRGLLLISTLLIPLNFLAAIALSKTETGGNEYRPTDPLYLTAVGVGLLSYGVIAFSSSRIFRKRHWWPMWLGVMIPSAGQLVIDRLTQPGQEIWVLNALAALPVAGFVAATAAQLQIASRGRRFPKRRAFQTLQLLGIALFSLLMAVGLLVAKAGSFRATLAVVSPSLSIAAVLITATGLLLHRRVACPRGATRGLGAALRTGGTAVALFGASLMLAGLALAWPRPELLVAVGLVNFAALTVMAVTGRLPALHVPAIGSAALTVLTAVHWIQGTVEPGTGTTSRNLIDALLMGRSSLVLLATAVVCWIALRGWKSLGREDDGRNYAWGAAGLGGLSLLTAFVAGFITEQDVALTTPVFAVGAIGLLTACRLLKARWAAWGGAVLTFTTFYHTTEWNDVVVDRLSEAGLLPVHPMVIAALLTGGITSLFAFVESLRSRADDSLWRSVIQPLCVAAFVASALALPRILVVEFDQYAIHTGYLFCVAGIWGVIAAALRFRPAFVGAQAVSVLAVGFAAVAVSRRMDWAEAGFNFADPRYWQMQIGLQAVWCLLWVLTRRLPYLAPGDSPGAKGDSPGAKGDSPGAKGDSPGAKASAAAVLGCGRWNVDHVVLAGVVIAAVGLCIVGVLPGIAAELQAVPAANGAGGMFVAETTDAFALIGALLVLIAVLFAVSFASTRTFFIPLFFGGSLIVLFIATKATEVTAESFAAATGASAAHAVGTGTWIVLAVSAAALLAALWERVTRPVICGLIVLGGLAAVELAAHLGGVQAHGLQPMASLLRWSLAGYSVLVFIVITFREKIAAVLSLAGFDFPETDDRNAAASRTVGFAATVWPVLALTIPAVVTVFSGAQLSAFPEGSWIAELGMGLSYGIPLWVLAAVLLTTAIAERKSEFAISASLLIQLGLTLFFVLPVWQAADSLGGVGLAELVQWNAIGLGVCTLLWMIGRRWIEKTDAVPLSRVNPVRSPFGIQLMMAATVTAVLSLWATAVIVVSPGRSLALMQQLGDVKSFIAFGLTATAVVLTLCPPVIHRGLMRLSDSSPRPRVAAHRLSVDGVIGSVLLLVPLAAAACGYLETNDSWLSYHVLTAGWTAMLLGLTAMGSKVETSNGLRSPAESSGLRPSDFPIIDKGTIGQSDDQTIGESESPKARTSDGPTLPVPPLAKVMMWALPLGGVVLLLGLRSQWGDPQRPWWLVGTAGAVAVSTTVFGLLRRSQPLAYLSAALVLVACTAALSEPWLEAPPPVFADYLHVIEWNVMALAGTGLFWLAVEMFWQRRRGESFDPRMNILSEHHAAGGIGLMVTGLLAVCIMFIRAIATEQADAPDWIVPFASPAGWGAVASVGVLLIASLWDRRARFALPAVFTAGLVTAAVALDGLDLDLQHVWLGVGLVCAGYVATTGGLWWQRGNLGAIARRLRIPDEQRDETSTASWLPAVNLYLAGLAVGIHFWAVLTFEDMNQRLTAGIATAVLAPGFACFATDPRDFGKSLGSFPRFRFLTLLTAVVAAVQVVWCYSPGSPTAALWLERVIRLLEVTSVATLVYAVAALLVVNPALPPVNPPLPPVNPPLPPVNHRGLNMPGSRWGETMRRVAVTVGGVSLATLAAVLIMEGTLFEPKQVPITVPQIVVVSVILVGLAAGLIVLAVLPGRDPFRLSERGRMGYVYAAEVVGSLLFLHIWLTKPRLFEGMLRPYWPFIVISIAFVSVGLGEFFRRKKLRVLAEPLERSGTFLPLLPAIALWVLVSERGFNQLSLGLALIGVLYVLLAMLRKSFLYAMTAAVFGNLALWSLYSLFGISLLTKPQVWLIPPALSVLVAGHLNRRRLSEAQLTTLRYVCMTLIYISSTSEMFIAGAGRSIWHPMVLASLSICGVLAGIMLRIRAFLYLGASFLFLSVVSMVWHAAQSINEVWPWWVFGIVLGLVLLVLFGLFEKRRNDVLKVVNRLKQWER